VYVLWIYIIIYYTIYTVSYGRVSPKGGEAVGVINIEYTRQYFSEATEGRRDRLFSCIITYIITIWRM